MTLDATVTGLDVPPGKETQRVVQSLELPKDTKRTRGRRSWTGDVGGSGRVFFIVVT